MLWSTARFWAMGAAVVMAGCGFGAKVQPSAVVDAGSQAGTGGVAGTGGSGGRGGAGGRGGTGPAIIIQTDAGGGTATGSLDTNCGLKTLRLADLSRFCAAPARAEEMYSPKTFGRSSGQTVLVE